MVGWIPDQLFEVLNPVIFHFHPFRFEEFLHHGWCSEMVAAGQVAIPVDYPVCGYGRLRHEALVHGDSYYPRGTELKVFCDGAIGGHTAVWDLTCHMENILKKVV